MLNIMFISFPFINEIQDKGKCTSAMCVEKNLTKFILNVCFSFYTVETVRYSEKCFVFYIIKFLIYLRKAQKLSRNGKICLKLKLPFIVNPNFTNWTNSKQNVFTQVY